MKLYNSKDIKVGSTGGVIALKGRQVLWRKGKSVEIFDQVGTYNWTCPIGVWEIDILVVAGGGSGGGRPNTSGAWHAGGGGAAGGVIYRTISVIPGQTYEIIVGAGGAATARNDSPNSNASLRNGKNSKFDHIVALGGGAGGDSAGGSSCLDGLDGGAGGGASSCGEVRNGGSGIPYQGHDGAGGRSNDGFTGNGLAGSGGSATGWEEEGHVGGAGGDGANFSDIFGIEFGVNGYIAGGGGAGSSEATTIRAAGGLGGGGAGGTGDDVGTMDGLDGAGQTGSGGGGGGRSYAIGGNGGGGIVALKYQPESNRSGVRRFKKDRNSNEASGVGDSVGWTSDLSPYRFHATQIGASKPVVSEIESKPSVHFSRSSEDCLLVDSEAGSHLDQLSEFTIEAWVYFQNLHPESYMYMVNRNVSAGTGDWAYCLGKSNADELFLNVNGTMVLTVPNTILINDWMYLGAVYKPGANAFYLNDTLVASNTLDLGPTVSKPHLQISGRSNDVDQTTSTYGFDGSIKEVRIWGIGKTQTELRKLKDIRLWGDEPNLLGYWPL